jgi:branched-subunit amino acid aminotransferase/4-amino-4-deoxychorismate lyase
LFVKIGGSSHTNLVVIAVEDNRITERSKPADRMSRSREPPIGYYCGQLLPQSEIRLPLSDAGLTQGILVSEQLRTLGGRIHLLDRHLQRLERSAAMLFIRLPLAEIRAATEQVVAHNWSQADSAGDLRVSILVTPGDCKPAEAANGQPTIVITTGPLPFAEHANWYEEGLSLASVEVREIPGQCIPRQLKHRNRIHYWLAEHQAGDTCPGARALLLDGDGNVCESAIAAIALIRDGTVLVPPADQVLGSISFEFTATLMAAHKIEIIHRNILPAELLDADEVIWFNTTVCLAPVTRFNQQLIGDGQPGPLFRQLLHEWSLATGVDIARQARKLATMGGSDS